MFLKCYRPSYSKELSVIKNFKDTVPWTYAVEDLTYEESFGTFDKQEMQKKNQS